MIQFISSQLVGKCFRHGASNTGFDPDFQQLFSDFCTTGSCNRTPFYQSLTEQVILNNNSILCTLL
ncbi:hypothetical protein CCAJJPOJ_02924 [Lelliottia sp. T2.26D-8]|nr:hypothetical protein [Lelliottia amnigena]CAI9416059.1 hypothetical protein CCAJJPOJ_02924 [Lelliottia sp. T2.26D-8]